MENNINNNKIKLVLIGYLLCNDSASFIVEGSCIMVQARSIPLVQANKETDCTIFS